MWVEHGFSSVGIMWGFSGPCLTLPFALHSHPALPADRLSRRHLPVKLREHCKEEALDTTFLLEVKILSQSFHLASEERNRKFLLGPPTNAINHSFCIIPEKGVTVPKSSLQMYFQLWRWNGATKASAVPVPGISFFDGFRLCCSQGCGSTFVFYISRLFKATPVPSFISYTSKLLWPHLLTAHTLWHLLFIRKYIIFVLKNSVRQNPCNSSTKTHYIRFTKNLKTFS